MNAAEVLFHQFPRYVGPKQRLVHNRKQLLQQVFQNSGLQNAFTSVYAHPFDNNQPLIDKLFFDFDGDLINAHKQGQTLFEWYQENHFDPIPLWTGGRGPHIYPRCTNTIHPNSADFIRRAAYYALDETGLYTEETDSDGNCMKVPLSDSKVIGDTRRLTRYPGTQRASHTGTPLPTFCIPLDPNHYLDMTLKHILSLEKDPTLTNPNITSTPTRSFKELPLDNIKLQEWKSPENLRVFNSQDFEQYTKADPSTINLIKCLIPRPCIHNHIIHPKAPDPIRFAATCELRDRDLPVDFTIKTFAKLGWDNFQLVETGKQVRTIHAKRNVTTIGKRKMKEMGFCNPIDCDACNSCR